MELSVLLLMCVFLIIAFKCGAEAWYLHSETTDRAGERYTDRFLASQSREEGMKTFAKSRRNMKILTSVVCLSIAFILKLA